MNLIFALILSFNIGYVQPTIEDCEILSHPYYDIYHFQGYAWAVCPEGHTIDMSCFLAERQAYWDALRDIDAVYGDWVCICYNRWLIHHNDAELLDCIYSVERTIKHAFQNVYERFHARVILYCCFDPR